MTKARFLAAAALLTAAPWRRAWPTRAITGITTAITGPCPTRSATSTIMAPASQPGTFAYYDGPSTNHCEQGVSRLYRPGPPAAPLLLTCPCF